MQYQDRISTEVREHVVRAVVLYAHNHAVHRLRETAPGTYTLRHRHDTDGHADEQVFLVAMVAHPNIAHVEQTTCAEDELLGVDALVTVRGENTPIPIDFTTKGRGVPGGVANLHDTLKRGVVPVVMEIVPDDLTPTAAFTAFTFWRARAEEYFRASA